MVSLVGEMCDSYNNIFSPYSAEDFKTEFPVLITLSPGSPTFLCTRLAINDDSISEITENLQMELCLVDTELADQVMLSSNQVNIIIQDNDST